MGLKHTTNPKATSTIIFHNQIPIADKQRFRSMASGFSGLIVAIDKPIDTRGKAPEKVGDPNSPKISCIGQISKCKIKKTTTESDVQRVHHQEEVKSKRKPASKILKIFGCVFFGSRAALLGNSRSNHLQLQLSKSDFEWMGEGDEESKGGVVVLQPRREINLWQRRKTASPPPLQV